MGLKGVGGGEEWLWYGRKLLYRILATYFETLPPGACY